MSMVTVEEFIASLDREEAADLSHLNLPNDPAIYKPKIQTALDEAEETVLSYLTCIALPLPDRYVGAVRRWIKKIARYDLDYNNRRDSVEAEWERFETWAFSICPAKKYESGDDGGGLDPGVEPVMSIFTI